MRLSLALASLVLGTRILSGWQAPVEGKLLEQLQRLFPSASTFSPRTGSPPHFKAYKREPSGAQTLLGLAFWTTELEPLERAYDGPIKILVGMDPNGILSGIVVANHHEPYGYFSVDLPAFAAQPLEHGDVFRGGRQPALRLFGAFGADLRLEEGFGIGGRGFKLARAGPKPEPGERDGGLKVGLTGQGHGGLRTCQNSSSY